MVPDLDLLDAWRGGDTAAGSQLFERHFGRLYRFFSYKVGDDVEDLIQQTLLACVESRDRFAGNARFSTYLLSIARNKLCDYWRRRSRNDALDFGVSSLADLGPTPTQVVAKRREERVLLEALRSLSVDLQVALEMHYWEDMSGPELAVVLGIPEGTVRSRLRRAKQALHDRLAELCESPAVLESTLQNLDGWAAALKDAVASP